MILLRKIENTTDTPQTNFLKLNSTNEDVKELYYYQMPQFYVWNINQHKWTKRIKFIT